MRHNVALSLPLLATLLPACGPSINAAAKADVDRQVGALQVANKQFPAPPGSVPVAMGVGQWTKHKLTDDNNQPALMTYKVVGEDAGYYWVEMVNETYTGRTVMKMLVSFGDRTNPANFDVRSMKIKDEKGQINELPPQFLSMMKSTWQPALSTLVVNWQGLPQEDVAVPAGKFSACFKGRSDASWGPHRSSETIWSHPAVPLSGVVKSQGIDKPHTMELVDFGFDGASSEL